MIRCAVDGEVNEYEIRITKVDMGAKEVNKGIILEVTDQELLEAAGGIVQGMSGSPIIQNGKLVGAVTHVSVSYTHLLRKAMALHLRQDLQPAE